jgi:hypothetical protein
MRLKTGAIVVVLSGALAVVCCYTTFSVREDFIKPLPRGYELVRTNADTVFIQRPSSRETEITIPARIDSVALVPGAELIVGVGVPSADQHVGGKASGYFLLDTRSGFKVTHLSYEQWSEILNSKYSIIVSKIRLVDVYDFAGQSTW